MSFESVAENAQKFLRELAGYRRVQLSSINNLGEIFEVEWNDRFTKTSGMVFLSRDYRIIGFKLNKLEAEK